MKKAYETLCLRIVLCTEDDIITSSSIEDPFNGSNTPSWVKGDLNQ